MTEERFKLDERDYSLAILENDEVLSFQETVDLLNKQDYKIRELEGITKRLDRLNNKLIQENTEQCKTCELAKIQHEQIQELKQQLSKIPDSVKKNWI